MQDLGVFHSLGELWLRALNKLETIVTPDGRRLIKTRKQQARLYRAIWKSERSTGKLCPVVPCFKS